MRSRLKAAIALAMLGGGLIASSFALAGTSKGEARAAELEAIQTDLATRNPISPNAAALPPLALYSNVGTDAGAFLLNGGVSTSGTTRYTSMVCNRVTLSQPGSQLITGFSFAIHNENAAAFTPSQVSIQFYDDSGANGGPGTRLLNRSGLYIGGGSFSGVNMPVGASVWTGLPSGYTAAYVPAQTTTQVPRVWACLYFGGTSAQVAQLANLGMQKYANAPTAGSTEDLAFVSTVGALNPPSNPAGTLVTGSGAANVFGWELTTLGTNTLLDSYQIVDATGAVANPVRPINTAAAGVERNFSGYAATISVPPAPAGTWNATGLVLYATCPTVGNFSNVQAKVQFWDTFNGSTAADVFANSSPLASATLDLGPVNCTSTTAINTFAARLPTPAPLGRGGKLGITVGYAADSGSGLVNGAFMEVLATTTTTNPFPAVGTNASTGATGWYKSASNRADLNFTGTTDYVSVANQHLAVRVFADMAAPTRTVTVGTDGPGSGTVTPGTGNVYEGLSATYTLTPAAGNHLVTVVGNCPGTLSGSRYVVGPVTGDCSFKAVYAPGVATNGLYRSPTMNHTLLANSDGSTLNVVSAAWDDTGPSSGNWDLNFWASSGALRVWTVSTYADKLVGSPFSLLSSGGVVNSSSTFSATGATITPAAAWLAGADGYFGFQFVCNGRLANPVASPGICYGYARMTTTGASGYPATLVDYVYDGDGNPVTIGTSLYSVASSVGAGSGYIDPTGSRTVVGGQTTTYQLYPSAGYHVASVTGCGGSYTAGASSYTTGVISADCAVVATFAADVTTYTVTPSVGTGSGTISPNTPQTVNSGATATFTLAAASGFHVDNVTGTCNGTLTGNSFTTAAITQDCTVVANFAADTGGSEIVCSAPLNHTTLANGNGSYYNWITGVIVDDGASGPPGYHFNPYGASKLSFFWGSNTKNAGVADTASGTTWKVLQAGAQIGPSSTFSRGTGNATNWILGTTDGYLGFSFDCSTLVPAPASGTCYGYAHMTATGTTGIPSQVIDYCYNKAGNPITIAGTGGPIAPTIAKAFSPASVQTSANSTLTITLSNANPAAATLSAALTDTFPTGLVTAATPNASTTCTGGAGVTTTSGSVTLASGAAIPASGSCTVKVDVTSATAGSYANTIAAGALQTDKGNNALAASATLTVTPVGGDPDLVCAAPNHALVNTFDGSSINWITGVIDDVGNQIHWNPYNAASSGTAMLAFYWPTAGGGGGVASGGVYSVLQPGNTIGSSSTFIADTGANTSAVSSWRAGANGYLGFKLTCPAGTCYGYAHLTTTATGGFPATLVDYCYNKAGNPITITGGGSVAPTIAKAFSPTSVQTGASSTLTITLSNANPAAATLSAALTDTFPTGLVTAATPNASTTCTGGAGVTTTSGSVTLASGAAIPASGSCTVKVDVTSATAGSYANTIAAGALQTDKGNNASAASATLTVTGGGGGTPTVGVTPASLSASQTVGASTTQTLTIANTGGGTLNWTIAEENASALPAMPASPRIAQPARETVGTPVKTVVDGQSGKASSWMAPLASLYDNGPLVTNPGAGAGGKDASALQTAVGNTSYGANISVSGGFRVADDFTVPAGGWTVDKITFFTYQTGSSTTSTINAVNLRIWNGRPGAAGSTVVFGDTATNRLASTAFANIYRVLDTDLTNSQRPVMAVVATVGTTLPAGTYWVDWQIGGTLSSGPWAPAVTIAGATGKPGANSVQYDGTSWVASTDGGSLAAQDYPFLVEGSGGGGTPACTNPSDIPWLSVGTTSGSNAGGTNTPVTVTFNATGMAAGSYSGRLCVNSNDAANPTVAVPVSFTVTPAGGNNGIITSGPLSHSIINSTLGTSLNMVTSAFDDGGSTAAPWDFNFWGSSGVLTLWKTGNTGAGHYAVDASGKAKVFQVGDIIGPSTTFTTGTTSGSVAVAAAWLAGTDGYLGVKFNCNGRLTFPVASGVCYGYIHMQTTAANGFPATILDTAFDGDGNQITITGGTPLNPPVASVSPILLNMTSRTDQTATSTLNIANAAGSSALTWSISARPPSRALNPVVTSLNSKTSSVDASFQEKLLALRSRPKHGPASIDVYSPIGSSKPWVPSGSIQFVLDDGSYEGAIGWTDGGNPATETAAVWLNRFHVDGATTIDSVSIMWPQNNGGSVVGKQANIVVYYDSASTGSPAGAVRLGTDKLVTIASLDTFENYVTSFSVPGAGDVYIGFVDHWAMSDFSPALYPAALDSSSTSHNASFISANDVGAPDLATLANNDYNATIGALSGNQYNGNWLIRATGTGGGAGGFCTGPVIPWLTATPSSGSVNGGANVDVAIKANPAAGGLSAGSYTGELCITTNDPARPLLSIPVNLTVTAAPVAACSAADTIFCDGFDGAPVVNPNIHDSGVLNLNIPSTIDGIYLNWLTGATCTTGCNDPDYHFDPYGTPSGSEIIHFWWPNAAGGDEGGVGSASTTRYSILASGATIGPASEFITLAGSPPSDMSNWAAGVNGYLGFKFSCPAGVCYGYVNLTTTAPNGYPAKIVRYWYDSSGAAITIP